MTTTLAHPQLVRFGEFELNLQSGELCHNGARVLLPDQPFRLLAILIREHGSLVTREDLRRELWSAGTFVDFEPSLNAAVKRLREALGDSATAPRFIETLPRRGYRFIAVVDGSGHGPLQGTTSAVALAAGADAAPVSDQAAPALRRSGKLRFRAGRRTISFLIGGIAAAALIVFVAIKMTSGAPRAIGDSPRSQITRLTNLGTIRLAAVSPDGRQLAYVRTDEVRESLWLRKIDGENPIQLVAPVDGVFRSVTFGPDGFVYYTLLRPDLTPVPLRRVAVGGGPSEPLIQASGGVSFSPDGSRYAYVSTTSMALQESRIVVVDMNGGPTRAIAVRRAPDSFERIKPAWSPDGTQLAVVATSDRAPSTQEILLLDVHNGDARKTATFDRLGVTAMLWLPDRTGFVLSAAEHRTRPQRLWHLTLSSGALTALTHDVSDYSLAGLAPDGHSVVAVRGDVARSLWVAETSRLEAAQQVAADSGDLSGFEGLSWAPDGRLFYGTAESGNVDIWSYDVATQTRQRITSDPGEEFHPAVSPDGRTLVFASSASDSGLWAMSTDGRGRRRLTKRGDTRPAFFPDGRSVAFQRMTVDTLPFTIERVAITGGVVTQIGANHTMRPSVSPDGRFVAHYWMTPEHWRLGVTAIGGPLPVMSLPILPTHSGRVVHWSPDGAALAYIDGSGGAWNIWTQPLDGGPARSLTQFTEGRIATFDWSRDGSRLAWTRINEVRDVVSVRFGAEPVSVPRVAPRASIQ